MSEYQKNLISTHGRNKEDFKAIKYGKVMKPVKFNIDTTVMKH